MSAQGVIILGHGSRHPGIGRPFASLQIWLQAELGPACRVEDAYLSLCAPTLERAIETLQAEGIAQVAILPLFLVAGHHVSEELPGLIDAAAERWPHLELSLAPHLGAFGDIAPLLRQRLSQAQRRVTCVPALGPS